MTAISPDQTSADPIIPAATNITDNTVIISVTCGSLGNSRKVSTSAVEVDTDKSMIRVNKTLLDAPELMAITKLDGEMRRDIANISLPSFFRSGFYLVSIAAIEKAQGVLKAHDEKRKELIDKFLKAYAERKNEAETRLKGLYNAADYPSPSRVRACFIFEWQWLEFRTSSKLKEISNSFFEEEKEKAANQWKNATEEITLLLRSNMKDLVDHLVERLTPGADGKPKKFKGTTVENIKSFLENFSIRNVTNDSQLDAIVKAAQSLLSGVDAQTLRDNDAVRSNTVHGFAQVKQHLDGLVTEAGSRKITFDDEEPVVDAEAPAEAATAAQGDDWLI